MGKYACPWIYFICATAFVAGCDGNFEPSPIKDVAALKQVDVTTLQAMQAATRPTTLPAAEPALVNLSLEEARQLALENNLELKVAIVAPAQAKEGISQQEAAFEATFRTDISYSQSDVPTSTKLEGSQGNGLTVTPGLAIPLRTGGQIALSLPMNRSETDNSFATLNPAYTSDLAASISLPLLRGAGPRVTLTPLRIAQLDAERSMLTTRLEVIRILANVDRAYWRLYAARRALEVRQKDHELAVAQLERARRQVKAGVSAEIEVMRAESGVADRLGDIIDAEIALRDRQREIKRIINRPGAGPETATIVVPTTPPNALPYKLDPSAVLSTAMQYRMELVDIELRLMEDTLNIGVARNGMLPLVTLEYDYNVNALGNTITGSWHVLEKKDFEDHRVSLHIEVPVGNEMARSRLRQAMLNRLLSLRNKDLKIQAIQQEVLSALDQLESNWQRMVAAQNRVVLAARVVDGETRQFMQGARTSTDVLDAQAKLADAQTAEIAALTQYQISQVDVAYATGMLLGAAKVAWEPEKTPRP